MLRGGVGGCQYGTIALTLQTAVLMFRFEERSLESVSDFYPPMTEVAQGNELAEVRAAKSRAGV